MSLSYAVRVYESKTDQKGAISGQRFATIYEADRAAQELFSRWFGPDRYEVEPSDDAPNYEFPADISRPRPIGSAS